MRATSRPPMEDDLNRSNRQPYHSGHLKTRMKKSSILPLEEAPSKRVQRKRPTNMTFERIDLKDKD